MLIIKDDKKTRVHHPLKWHDVHEQKLRKALKDIDHGESIEVIVNNIFEEENMLDVLKDYSKLDHSHKVEKELSQVRYNITRPEKSSDKKNDKKKSKSKSKKGATNAGDKKEKTKKSS